MPNDPRDIRVGVMPARPRYYRPKRTVKEAVKDAVTAVARTATPPAMSGRGRRARIDAETE